MSGGDSTVQQELPLLIGAGNDRAEALLLIGRRRADSTVVVRRWSGFDWSAPAEERVEHPDVLLAWIEQQAKSGRSLNQSLYAVRLWLQGIGPAAG